MKKPVSISACIYSLVAGLVLIASGFVLDSLRRGFEDETWILIGKYGFYGLLGLGALTVVVSGILLLAKAASKRVSEFALHVMRFSIIVVAVSFSVFVMLENDYNAQSAAASDNELRQLDLAASVYLREAVGERIEDDSDYLESLKSAVSSLVTDDQQASGISASLFIFGGADTVSESIGRELGSYSEDMTYFILGQSALAGSADARIRACVGESALLLSESDLGDISYSVSSVPVYGTTSRCVGVLEFYRNRSLSGGLDLVDLELIITIAGAVILLIILYYALSHLIDILLRPRKLLVSRAFKLGNEAIRPISLLMAMCCTMPLCPIFFDFGEIAAPLLGDYLPKALLGYIPLLTYMLCVIVGSRIGGLPKNKLLKLLILLGGLISAGGYFSVLYFEQPLYKLIGIAAGGLGYGVASRVVDKYRVYGRYCSDGDAKVIYSPYLGLAAGALLGAFFYVRGGSSVLFAASCAVILIVVILSLGIFRNASCSDITRDGDEDFLNEAYTRRSVFGRFGVLAVSFSLLLSFGWFYLTVYLGSQGITTTAITFGFACVILGGGVLGNLYRKAETPRLRAMFGLSGVFLAASVVPFALSPSTLTAIICYALLFIGEILGHGTINAYMTQNSDSRDRIGYWGQGNLLLELVSLGSVVGGVFLLEMENPTVPMLIIAFIAAAIGTINLVLILSTKPIEPPPVLATIDPDKDAYTPVTLSPAEPVEPFTPAEPEPYDAAGSCSEPSFPPEQTPYTESFIEPNDSTAEPSDYSDPA